MNNQKGFSLFLVLLVLVSLSLIIGVGYYIFSKADGGTPSPYSKSAEQVQTKNDSDTSWLCRDSTECTSLEKAYNDLKSAHSLKYKTFPEAVAAFKSSTNEHMYVERISTYVPGKIPREDGDPYFIGFGKTNGRANECIVGYFNLITSVSEFHKDACIVT